MRLDFGLEKEGAPGMAGSQLAKPAMGCILKGPTSHASIPNAFRFASAIRSIAFC